MANLKVRDLMTDNVLTLTPEDNLLSLYDLMDSRHIRHVPVVDGEGELVGIVSDRDLLKGALGAESGLPMSLQRQMLETMTVDDIMNTEPVTVEPDAGAREAGENMMEFKVSCLPVVEADRLVGILTESDFVRYICEQER